MLKGIVSGAPVDISRIAMMGKNLFDKSTVIRGERVLQNSTSADANISHTDYISVSGIDSISVNELPAATNFYFYDSKSNNSIGYVKGQTAEVPAGAKYVRVNINTSDIDSFMLNSGSTPLPYEPYGMQQGWEVRDQQGTILWGANKTLTGTSSIPMKGYGLPLVGMTLEGNETQTGTPTPDSPIWPDECGDFVTTGEHAGLYAIPITLNGTTQNIYLDEPLRKIGDYADVLNSDGTVTRKIKKQAITELANRDNFNGGYTVDFDNPCGFGTLISNIAISTSSLPTAANRQGKVFTNSSKTFIGFGSQPEFPIANTSGYPTTDEKAAFLSYISTHEVYVWYVLATPTTEQVTVPTLTPADGNDTLTVGTTLAPSTLSITGHVKARSV